MTTEDVLLNDVLDNPDDVEPRLYYADLTATGLPGRARRKTYTSNGLAIHSLCRAALALGRSYRESPATEGRNT